MCTYIVEFRKLTVTYDHRLKKIGHPVRSAILKLQIGRLVVGWVTTSEYLLLYVFFCVFSLCGVVVTGFERKEECPIR
jgi:hypothetical protein